MNQEERDKLFIAVRYAELAEAREAVSKADMSWLHSTLQQNMLFFVAARRRRGCELLAQDCIRKGVDLSQIDSHNQTPLFWAAALGNLVMMKFLLSLGMEINFRDNEKKTALFFAISNNHLEAARYLIEQGASLDVVAVDRTTPRKLLKSMSVPIPDRKRKLWAPDPQAACPGASTRSRFAIWEWGQEEKEEPEPLISKSTEHVVVENTEYFVTDSLGDCSKRLRRSEREFCGDHAHLHQHQHWYKDLQTEDAAGLVDTPAKASKEHLRLIEAFATGSRPGAFTLAAVSQKSRTVAGYIHASLEDDTMKIKHVKADRPHQGKGLGGLLLLAAEKRALKLASCIAKAKLSVLDTNGPAKRCYAKAGFKVASSSRSTFPPCGCKNNPHCNHRKIKWLQMEKCLH
ncbi:Tanc1 [Symbiodinium sp. CCMP2456]|nr:Tanc1 [Symbiodinium sp. CCMP2456]